MTPIVLVAPGPLDARTGGYIYDRRMVEGLRRLGWQVDVLELDASFPHPTPAALEHASRALAAVRAGTITIVDSLALGAMAEIITREASRLPVVALVHLPLAAAIGLDREDAARFEDGERRALAAAALVVVTGRAALPLIARYAVDASRVVVVEPGTDRAPLAHGSRTGPVELLTVATLNPGKGHEMLLEALSAAGRFGVAADLCGEPHARSRDGRARARSRCAASAGGSRLIRRRSRSSCAGRVLRPGGCRRPRHAAGDLRNGRRRSVGARAPGRRHDDRCDSGSGGR